MIRDHKINKFSSKAAINSEMIITNELASSHWTAIQMDDYARRITEATDGRIQAKVFHSSSLYNDQSALAALGTGAVHMAWPVAVRLETIAPQTVSATFSAAPPHPHRARPERAQSARLRWREARGACSVGVAVERR